MVVIVAKGQKHYLPDGKLHMGPTHKSGDKLMTGAKHTASSKVLTHSMPKAGKKK